MHAGGAGGGRDAYAPVALAAVQLGGLVGVEAELLQNWVGHGGELVRDRGGGQLGQARAEHEAALHVACHKAVVSQGYGEAVCGGAGQAGGLDEVAQGDGAGLEAVEDERGLVEYTHAGGTVGVYLYHLLIGVHVLGGLDGVDDRCVVLCGCVDVTHSVCAET